MSRTDKLTKLGNAVRAYRGTGDNTPRGMCWRNPPQHNKQPSVLKWLDALGINLDEGMEAVHGFKTLNDFDAWLKSLAVKK